MDNLSQFLAAHPHIHYATPASADFDSLRAAMIINKTAHPAMIVRPRTAEDVAALVAAVAANDIPFTVRVGGHDLFGRSHVDAGVTIDLREIAHVHVDRDSRTARVGGGVISMALTKQLGEYGLVTPHGNTPSVGYVGWATHGGYGPLSPRYGLGADQIVGARVVDARGQLREADEDMLTALRGGGALVCVVVELTIKVYPLEQVLAGLVIYDSSNLSQTIKQYNDGYRKLKAEGDIPPPLSLYQCLMNGPQGKGLAVVFVWASSDLDAGNALLEKIRSWAPVAMSTVAPTTMAAHSEVAEALAPKQAYGSILTLTVTDMSSEVVDVFAAHAHLQPNDPVTLLGIHEWRPTPSQRSTDTVVANRSPHFVLEVVPIVSTAEAQTEALAWAQGLHDAILATDPANRPPSTYLPLTSPDRVNLQGIYGDKYETLQHIKQKYDPGNVFKNTMVQL